MKRVAPEVIATWTALGNADGVQFVHPDCAHDFPPEVRRIAYTFLDAHLKHTPAREVPAP